MAVMNQVSFARGTSVTYSNTYPVNNDTLYFLHDVGQIYLGSTLIADKSKFVQFSVIGSGDVVTDVAFDVATQTMTVTLGEAGSAASVRTALDDIRANVITDVKAGSLSGNPANSSVVVTKTGTEAEVALRFADPAHTGSNVVFGECSEGLFADVTIPAPDVTGVKANDKILALHNGELETTLSITATQKLGTTYVQLLGINNEVIAEFDAADFVKDGMLDTVEIGINNVGKKVMRFTFNTASGKSVIEVELTDLIDIYTGKGSIKVANNEISIDNSVTPVTTADPNLSPNFGETVTLYTVRYNAEGLVQGRDAFNFTIPALGIAPQGMVGDSTKATLVKWASIDATGKLTGDSVDLINELTVATATNSAVPTAKAVYDAIEAAKPVWGKIQ